MRTNRVQFHLDMLCMTCSEPSWCFAPLLRLPCIRLHLICKHDRDDDVGDNGDGDDDGDDDGDGDDGSEDCMQNVPCQRFW